jgi:hypothetical protein
LVRFSEADLGRRYDSETLQFDLKTSRNCCNAGDGLLTAPQSSRLADGKLRTNLLRLIAQPIALLLARFRPRNQRAGRFGDGSEDGMRRRAKSRTVLRLIVLAGALALLTSSSHAQMCTPAIKDCESQADAEANRCALRCTRYDTICADRCDDTHDITVHYCWIKSALCKATDESQGFVRAASERK